MICSMRRSAASNKYFFSCLKSVVGGMLLIVVGLALAGCRSPQEERGYSPLPQNRPTDWEMRPFGDLRS